MWLSSARRALLHRLVPSFDASGRQKILVSVGLLRISTAYKCRKSAQAPRLSIWNRCIGVSAFQLYGPFFWLLSGFRALFFYRIKTGVSNFIHAGSAGITAASCRHTIPPSNRGTFALSLLRTVPISRKCAITLSLHLWIFAPFCHSSQFFFISLFHAWENRKLSALHSSRYPLKLLQSTFLLLRLFVCLCLRHFGPLLL